MIRLASRPEPPSQVKPGLRAIRLLDDKRQDHAPPGAYDPKALRPFGLT